MTNTETKRVGNWVLEWDSTRPSSVWAIPEYLKTIKYSDNGIMYDDGTMAWNFPERIPQSVRNAAPQFIRKSQGKRVK
jgi:hypothetical protein